MHISEPESLRKYHEALRTHDPEAERYGQIWRAEVDALLSVLQERTEEHEQRVNVLLATKERGVKPVYAALVKDYRAAVQLAKDISRVKKAIRDAQRGKKEEVLVIV